MNRPHHLRPLFLATFTLVFALHSLADASVTTFGSGSNQFDMTFVEIGNPGNEAHTGGNPDPAGSVAYAYQIGKYEVSEEIIDKFNASQSVQIYKVSRGPNKPATHVSWNDAARFVNWLNTSQGHQAAYNFTTSGENDHIALWSSAEAWQLGGENLFRHKDAFYFLPSSDEWYKAAYYDANTGNYFNYPTGSDTEPTITAGGTDPNTAVYYQTSEQGPAPVTEAGGLSAYGIMGMGGNAVELIETEADLTNDDGSADRMIRGGSFSNTTNLYMGNWNLGTPQHANVEDTALGFRVASIVSADDENVIPEPGSLLVWSLLGLAGFHVSRRLKK